MYLLMPLIAVSLAYVLWRFLADSLDQEIEERWTEEALHKMRFPDNAQRNEQQDRRLNHQHVRPVLQ